MTAAALAATDLPGGRLPTADPAVASGRALTAALGPARPAHEDGPAGGSAVTAKLADGAGSADGARGATAMPFTGTGAFRYAAGPGPVAGTTGPVVHFRVAVEEGIQQDDALFAGAVDAILSDPRGWTMEGLRFQRVPEPSRAEFTVFLASPVTSESMCAAGGLQTKGYVSCRLPGEVIINSARWSSAVPGYGAPIAVYRAYAINHEIGHQLGYGHEACPGPGRPAPVMQQQTYGLRGCVAYAWPYLDGGRYSGRPVA